jgi:hypothetical protein
VADRSLGVTSLGAARRYREAPCPTLSTVSTVDSCRAVAHDLQGKTLDKVIYVGLGYEGRPSDGWDFGDLHWPEVGVEVTTDEGEPYCAIWDHQVTHFDLTFAKGPISDRWIPLRDTPDQVRSWDVSSHYRWRPFLDAPLSEVAVITHDFDRSAGSGGTQVPVAVRLEASGESVWIVEAQPNDATKLDLNPKNYVIGSDEVIVIFGDSGAQAVGLPLP